MRLLSVFSGWQSGVWGEGCLGLPGPRLLAGAASGWPWPAWTPPPREPAAQVRQVRLFQDEEIYSDLYLTVCEWPSDASKVIVFGFK